MRDLPLIPTITAFERSPDRGKGLARDMRVRWALEEAGQPLWPAAQRGPPTSVLSRLNWRFSPASQRPAEQTIHVISLPH
jgi:hypothetical protein